MITNAPAKTKRINEQLMAYWQSMRKGRLMPLESDINPSDLAAIWPDCFLVQSHEDSFRYDYLGASLIEAYGDDFTGHEICEALLYPHPESLFRTFHRVYATAAPVMDESEFKNSKGVVIKYRSSVLPLAHASRSGVAFLLGGMRWKAY